MAIHAKIGYRPDTIVNDNSQQDMKVRTQPVIWQPGLLSDAPTASLQTINNHTVPPAITGDMRYHPDTGLIHVFNAATGQWTPASQGLGARTYLEERFLQRPLLNASIVPGVSGAPTNTEIATILAANHNFEITGTNAADAGSALANGNGTMAAGFGMTTTNADGDQMIVQPHTDTAQTLWNSLRWNPLGEVMYETIVQLNSILDIIVWAGLTAGSHTAPFNNSGYADAMFFYFDDGVSANWRVVTSVGGVDTIVTTTIPVVATATSAASVYHLMITVDVNRVPRYYINGTLVATGATLATTPATGYKPIAAVETDTTATKKITVGAIAMSRRLYQ